MSVENQFFFTHQVDEKKFGIHTWGKQKFQADIYQKTPCRAQSLQKEIRNLDIN